MKPLRLRTERSLVTWLNRHLQATGSGIVYKRLQAVIQAIGFSQKLKNSSVDMVFYNPAENWLRKEL